MTETKLKLLRIGVAGYCPPSKFDENKTLDLIKEAYDQLDEEYADIPKQVVSGWVNAGIPKLAYEEAVRRGYRTKGVASEKIKYYDLFLVDEAIMYGPEWGDESQTFVNSIDVLVTIGSGSRIWQEDYIMRRRKKQVIDYDLPKLN